MQRTFSPPYHNLISLTAFSKGPCQKAFCQSINWITSLYIQCDQKTLIDLQGINPLPKAVLVLPHYTVLTLLSATPRMTSNSSHTTRFIDCPKFSEFPIQFKSFLKDEFIISISLSSNTMTD